MQETAVWSLDLEDPLEKEMATYSSILAWEIPWIEEPSGLQSIESQRAGPDLATEQQQLVGEKVLRVWVPLHAGKFQLEVEVDFLQMQVQSEEQLLETVKFIFMVGNLNQGCYIKDLWRKKIQKILFELGGNSWGWELESLYRAFIRNMLSYLKKKKDPKHHTCFLIPHAWYMPCNPIWFLCFILI